jgi:uncharacterized membrane protein
MSSSPGRPGFWQIYREQYRKDSASTATRFGQLTSPVGLVIAAVLVAGRSVGIAVFLGVLAVVLFGGLLALDRRRRHRAGPDGGGQQPGRSAGPVPR